MTTIIQPTSSTEQDFIRIEHTDGRTVTITDPTMIAQIRAKLAKTGPKEEPK